MSTNIYFLFYSILFCSYYGDFLDIMFPHFPNHFLPFPMVFPACFLSYFYCFPSVFPPFPILDFWSGSILLEKANNLEIANFKASNRWVDRWKARNNVKFKTVSGEEKSYTPEMTAPWKETHLSSMMSRHKLENVVDADEFGLLFQALPNKTLELKGEKCSGGKHSKVRRTELCAVSAACENGWQEQKFEML